VREDWPESLKQFLNEARDLSMPRDIAPELLIDKPDFNEIYGMGRIRDWHARQEAARS
jgi:hypothetical protein